jgi:lysophospholipase L1-like esterase
MRWGPESIIERYGRPPYNPDDELGFTLILVHYAEVVRKIAAEEKVPLIDVYALYGEWERLNGGSCKQLMSDGMHPNTAGHRLVADALEPLIRAKFDVLR